MLENHCKGCTRNFDYGQRPATIICQRNHVLCRVCADEFLRNKAKCAECEVSFTTNNPYGLRESSDDKKKNVYPHQPIEQGNYPGNQPNYFQNNQGNQPGQWQQANMNPQPPISFNTHPKLKCFERIPIVGTFLIISIMVFVGALIWRINMGDCSYWGYYDCYYSDIFSSECCTYMCPSNWWDNNCYSLYIIQQIGQVLAVNIAIGFSAAVAILCIYLLVRAKRIAHARRTNGTRYIRV